MKLVLAGLALGVVVLVVVVLCCCVLAKRADRAYGYEN